MLAIAENRRQPFGLSPFAIDVLLAAAVAVAMMLTIGVAEEDDATRSPGPFAYSLGLLVAVFLLARRRRPLLVLLSSIGVLIAYYGLDYPAFSPAVPLAVAVYSAALAGRSLPAGLAIAGLLLTGVGWRVVGEGQSLQTVLGQGTITDTALFAALILLGEAVRHRRAWAREVQERLARSEREQRREAERRIEEERLRMARELHDVTAHTVAALNVHAAVAADALDSEPERARASLTTIREQSRDAMTELKAAIGLLRGDGEPAGEGRSPAPGIAQIEELVKVASAAGVRVTVRTEGRKREVPAAVDLTAYRIVQESLTNVVRHAGASTVKVRFDYANDALTVEIIDDGTGFIDDAAGPVAAGNGQAGHGLLGMHERAVALGGNLAAGPLKDGGYRVSARLPLEEWG